MWGWRISKAKLEQSRESGWIRGQLVNVDDSAKLFHSRRWNDCKQGKPLYSRKFVLVATWLYSDAPHTLIFILWLWGFSTKCSYHMVVNHGIEINSRGGFVWSCRVYILKLRNTDCRKPCFKRRFYLTTYLMRRCSQIHNVWYLQNTTFYWG